MIYQILGLQEVIPLNVVVVFDYGNTRRWHWYDDIREFRNNDIPYSQEWNQLYSLNERIWW